MKFAPPRISAAILAALLSTLPAAAQVVFDPSVFARQLDQLIEMKKQVDTLTSQLQVARDQLSEAKRLYDSVNKLTNANDIGALLNTPQFRKVLPQQFSEIEKLVADKGAAVSRAQSIHISHKTGPTPAMARIPTIRASSIALLARPAPSIRSAKLFMTLPRKGSTLSKSCAGASVRRAARKKCSTSRHASRPSRRCCKTTCYACRASP